MTTDDAVPDEPHGEDATAADDAVARAAGTLGDRGAHALLEYRQGRTQALTALVHEATPLLWHTVRAQGVDRDTADDVVQSVWAALVRNAHTIAEPHAVLKWLLVTARRAAWEAVRRSREDQRRRADLPDDAPDSPVTLRDPQPGPDAHVLTAERDRAVWRALERLPERCQELLRLVSLADRPDYRMISTAIGMPVGSIGATRGRCLAKLRTVLDDMGEGP
ncbi:RNA polymerase sigma factor [Xylanimonas ulmi]|uniref:RNA polymerase sigma factor (Sigma-70 family) n=1 Tax=Xylanimonas ulmi TaxID=228973 RepID=A0A4Q7MA70_9MICO|nr:sigma-70 family RNA polymerase sigma factor [Xylanibacterium ulmi]RZS63129.1 RNA polymerase sigma factor (sigma-70 family) [Xylanibacterium ulmi]